MIIYQHSPMPSNILYYNMSLVIIIYRIAGKFGGGMFGKFILFKRLEKSLANE